MSLKDKTDLKRLKKENKILKLKVKALEAQLDVTKTELNILEKEFMELDDYCSKEILKKSK